MAAIGMILAFGGWAASLIGGIAILVVAFKESVGQGVLNLLIPFYALYYVITRWEACKKGFLLSVGGGVVAALGAIVAGLGAGG